MGNIKGTGFVFFVGKGLLLELSSGFSSGFGSEFFVYSGNYLLKVGLTDFFLSAYIHI